MRLLTVVGARPNFMKAAPLIAAIRAHNLKASDPIDHILVHTGQHYDDVMSGAFFADLGLPAPDVHLGVGSASHAAQTGEIMSKFEGVLSDTRPDVVVVVGDVNSTLACALVAAKMSWDTEGSRPLVAHVEAGLRSFDRSMPEEINRIVTDHVADLLFVTEPSGVQNLHNEGVPADRIHFAGNTMIDSLLAFEARAEESPILQRLGLQSDRGQSPERYALLTLHRPANVDHRQTLAGIVSGLEELAAECPIVFPVHPRTQRRLESDALGSTLVTSGLRLTNPLGYLDFLCLMKHAWIVVTDSGGIQEETSCLGVPCVTVRENTERPITVTRGTNVIAGTQPERIKAAIRGQTRRRFSREMPDKWDGRAAGRILDVIVRTHAGRWRSTAAVSEMCG